MSEPVDNYGIIDIGTLQSYKKDNGEAEVKNYGYLKAVSYTHLDVYKRQE